MTASGSLNDNWGYLLILAIMFAERFLQETLYKRRNYEQTKLKQKETLLMIGEGSMAFTLQEKCSREEILEFVEAKSTALIYQSVKLNYQTLAMFVCLVSIGFMSNILGMIYIICALFAAFSYGIDLITMSASFMIIAQYILQLLNLTEDSAPLGFPKEIADIDTKGLNYLIPLDNLDENKNFAFDSFMYAMDNAQLAGIWIDFSLLLLLSYYLRVYKLPFNYQIIPEIKEIAKKVFGDEIRMKHRLEEKKKNILNVQPMQTSINEEKQDSEDVEDLRESENEGTKEEIENQALAEYEQVKKESSSSRWMIRLNYSRLLSQHIFVATFVSFLIVLNRSLVSIIALPIFLYMFSQANNNEFVKKDLPKLIKLCLGILIADIMIQTIL
jgi:hypothetical protein